MKERGVWIHSDLGASASIGGHMEKMVNTNSELDDLFPEKKRVKNPFVPIGRIYLFNP